MIENARYCSNLKMRVLSFPAAMCKNLSMFFMRSITLRRMRGCVTLALICVVVCERVSECMLLSSCVHMCVITTCAVGMYLWGSDNYVSVCERANECVSIHE